MTTLAVHIDVSEDGRLTIQERLPPQWRGKHTEGVLTLGAEPVKYVPGKPLPKATPEMLARRRDAMERLAASGGLARLIPDPVAWQREIRKDRPLPGRD